MMNEGKTENLKPNSRLSTPLLLLCIFLLIVQIANGLYFARGVEHSELFDFMYLLVFFWLVGWWMKEDSKRYGIHWFFDMGLFLYLAWFFIIPYYLFKTRGFKAFFTILSFLGIFLGAYLVGVVVAMIFTS